MTTTFDLLHISFISSSSVHIRSTHEAILELLTSEVRNLTPDGKFSAVALREKKWMLSVEKLPSSSYEAIKWWILTLLGQEGWEPFFYQRDGWNDIYHFRLKRIDD